MKINGQDVSEPNTDVLVIPRGEGQIVFEGRAVVSFETFDAMCPNPVVPMIMTNKGQKADYEDLGFKEQSKNYADTRLGWVIIQTLKPSEVEWDTVDEDDPKTYKNWVDDFMNSGFTAGEQNRILNFVLETNCLSEAKLERARADFLRGRQAEKLNG